MRALRGLLEVLLVRFDEVRGYVHCIELELVSSCMEGMDTRLGSLEKLGGQSQGARGIVEETEGAFSGAFGEARES